MKLYACKVVNAQEGQDKPPASTRQTLLYSFLSEIIVSQYCWFIVEAGIAAIA